MAKRISEFDTYSKQMLSELHLYANARYKRGDIPDVGEFEYISNRVFSKFPTAEFVSMKRIPIPVPDPLTNKSTEVWWEFKWVVYNYNKESEVK
jgi:hypothetical protein